MKEEKKKEAKAKENWEQKEGLIKVCLENTDRGIKKNKSIMKTRNKKMEIKVEDKQENEDVEDINRMNKIRKSNQRNILERVTRGKEKQTDYEPKKKHEIEQNAKNKNKESEPDDKQSKYKIHKYASQSPKNKQKHRQIYMDKRETQ